MMVPPRPSWSNSVRRRASASPVAPSRERRGTLMSSPCLPPNCTAVVRHQPEETTPVYEPGLHIGESAVQAVGQDERRRIAVEVAQHGPLPPNEVPGPRRSKNLKDERWPDQVWQVIADPVADDETARRRKRRQETPLVANVSSHRPGMHLLTAIEPPNLCPLTAALREPRDGLWHRCAPSPHRRGPIAHEKVSRAGAPPTEQPSWRCCRAATSRASVRWPATVTSRARPGPANRAWL